MTTTEVPAPSRRQQVTCPHCGRSVAGLLALCWRPDCLQAEIAADAAYEQAVDR